MPADFSTVGVRFGVRKMRLLGGQPESGRKNHRSLLTGAGDLSRVNRRVPVPKSEQRRAAEVVLPKNLAELRNRCVMPLPDSSSSAFRRVLFGIGCARLRVRRPAARLACSRSIDDCAGDDNNR